MSCGVECPNWNPQGKNRSFKAFSRWIFCTPKKTGTPQAALPSKVLDPLRNSKNIMPSRFPLRKHHFCFSFLKGNCDGWLQKKTSVAF